MSAKGFEPADAWDTLAEKLTEKLAQMDDADVDRELEKLEKILAEESAKKQK